jgi:hypothetical protein
MTTPDAAVSKALSWAPTSDPKKSAKPRKAFSLRGFFALGAHWYDFTSINDVRRVMHRIARRVVDTILNQKAACQLTRRGYKTKRRQSKAND